MFRSTIPTDTSFDRVSDMCKNVSDMAQERGLSATKPIRINLLGAMKVDGQEAATRICIVSFSQPAPSAYDIELWVNPINRRMFKSLPNERQWKPVLTRRDALVESSGQIGTPSGSDSVGQPVPDIVNLLAIDSSTLPDRTMYYVESERAIYALDLQGNDPVNPPAVIQPNVGPGRWYQITSTSSALGNIDGGIYS